MNTKSKGKAWFDKIYNKLETILVDSQDKISLNSSDTSGLDSVRDQPDDHFSDTFDMNHQFEGDKLLLQDHNDCNQTVTTSLCRKQPIYSQESLESFQVTDVEDKVANISSFTSNSMKVNQDELFSKDIDAAPLDIIDLYDMTVPENTSDFDDNLLYAAHDKTRQLRSFKRKIMDALTSKRRREKEYEQLSIWFGDAEMSSDLNNIKQSQNSKSTLHSNFSFASEDSEWELL